MLSRISVKKMVMTGLILLILVVASFYIVTRGGFQKLVLSTPVGGDFKIPSTEGIFDTKKERGKTIVLFFGFLNCPHVCPLTLSNLNAMMNLLPSSERSHYRVLFVSIDPERDTLEIMKKRFENYNGNIIGSTDEDDHLHRLVRLFGARYTRMGGSAQTAPFIDHTSDVFIINDKGEWVDTLRYESSPQEFLAAVKGANNKTPRSLAVKKTRMLEVLGENKNCDIGKTACKEILNDGEIEVKLGPLPVTTEKDLGVDVKSTSTDWTPTEVDFEGINLNMGLIRPVLRRSAESIYKGTFYLPVCELPTMQWRARVLMKSREGAQAAVLFYFETQQP